MTTTLVLVGNLTLAIGLVAMAGSLISSKILCGLGIAGVCVGVTSYAVALTVLFRDGWLRHRTVVEWDFAEYSLDNVRPPDSSIVQRPIEKVQSRRDVWPDQLRTVCSFFSPSAVRLLTLDLRAFDGASLSGLERASAKIYLNAVNLETGEQNMISPLIVAGLKRWDVKSLWDWQRCTNSAGALVPATVSIASAVAATTAFPPWFRPVRLVLHADKGNAFEYHYLV